MWWSYWGVWPFKRGLEVPLLGFGVPGGVLGSLWGFGVPSMGFWGSLWGFGVPLWGLGSLWRFGVPSGVLGSLWGFEDLSMGFWGSLWGFWGPYGVGDPQLWGECGGQIGVCGPLRGILGST